MGECCHALADYGQAKRCLREGLALWQQVGDPQWIAWALFQLGVLTASQGNTAEASATLAASLDLYRQRGDQWGVATVPNQLGAVAVGVGDYARAGAGTHRAAVSLNALGRTVLAQGETARAIAVFAAALAIFRQRNVRERTRLLVELDHALTPAAAATLQCEGARFDLPRAVALGHSIANG